VGAFQRFGMSWNRMRAVSSRPVPAAQSHISTTTGIL
jgi:hypothetical protein